MAGSFEQTAARAKHPRSVDDLSEEELALYEKLEECREIAAAIGSEFVEMHAEICKRGLLAYGIERISDKNINKGEILN